MSQILTPNFDKFIDTDEYAGFWLRVLATVIDMLLFSLISGFVHFLFFGNTVINVLPTEVVSSSSIQLAGSINWVEQGIITVVTIFMWIKFLGTPGKLILACRVVDAKTHQPLNIGQAVLRYVAYIVSVLPLFLGILWIAVDKRKQGFHDKIAGTVVILESASVHSAYSDKNDESQKTLQQLMAEAR